MDPGVLKDGITVADLVEQQNFLLRVRDTIAEASHQLRTRTEAGDAEGQRARRRRRPGLGSGSAA